MNKARVRLDYCDNGQGIDPELLPHIFEPFVKYQPTGIGFSHWWDTLSIIRVVHCSMENQMPE